MDWGWVLISFIAAVFLWYLLTALRWIVVLVWHRSDQNRQFVGHHAVAIVPGEAACAQAKHLAQHRMLAKEALGLPLQACDARECSCIYRHFDDRRLIQRRAPVHVKVVKSNRRHLQRGRRYEDGLVSG